MDARGTENQNYISDHTTGARSSSVTDMADSDSEESGSTLPPAAPDWAAALRSPSPADASDEKRPPRMTPSKWERWTFELLRHQRLKRLWVLTAEYLLGNRTASIHFIELGKRWGEMDKRRGFPPVSRNELLSSLSSLGSCDEVVRVAREEAGVVVLARVAREQAALMPRES